MSPLPTHCPECFNHRARQAAFKEAEKRYRSHRNALWHDSKFKLREGLCEACLEEISLWRQQLEMLDTVWNQIFLRP